MLALTVAAGLVTGLPVEFVVDLAGVERVKLENRLRFEFASRDGETHSVQMVPSPETKADSLRFTLTAAVLDDLGWQYEMISDEMLVIRGSRTSRVRSVTFTSQVWTPGVYPRLCVRPWHELAPKPRAVEK
jgi:hypothetical protein